MDVPGSVLQEQKGQERRVREGRVSGDEVLMDDEEMGRKESTPTNVHVGPF